MKGLDQVIDPSYKPMLAMYHQLRMNNKHIYDELKTEKFFSIRMVGIDPKMRGRGVATDLIRRFIYILFSFSNTKFGSKVNTPWIFRHQDRNYWRDLKESIFHCRNAKNRV